MRTGSAAFTVLELMLVVAIAGILAGIAIPGYRGYVERAHCAAAISDIKNISIEIDLIFTTDEELPDSLAELENGDLLDPWGNPYEYLRLDGAGPGAGAGGGPPPGPPGAGGAGGGPPPGPPGAGGGPPSMPRKDRFLVPINSDYDLYSKGANGESVAPLTAAKSRDDIIRAGDGAFIGLAERF
jgi:general secretion pathway protein G